MALPAGDPLWYYKVLGLHCDGTNGSTTFTDVKGKTATANGNAQISTAQYPSLTGKSSSGYLDGTGDYLSVPASSDFDFGSGDFTIKFLIRFSTVPGAGQYACLMDNRNGSGTDMQFTLWYGGTEKWYFVYTTDGSTQTSTTGISSHTPSAGTWYSVVWVRNGTSLKVYVDGAGSTSHNIGTATLFNSGSALNIGRSATNAYYMTGYLSEIEIYKGVAVHTADFTPSGDPFPDTYVRVSGTTRDAGGDFAARLVRVYRRDTGALVRQVVSDATTGEYAVTAANTGLLPQLKYVAYMHTTEEGIHVPFRVLGLHCDGANNSTTFTDVTGKTVTAYGNAKISTAQYPALTGKTSSAYFDGSGDYLTLADSADWDLGSGDFTLRALVYPTSVSTLQVVIDRYDATAYSWQAAISASGKMNFYLRDGAGTGSAINYNAATTLTLNAWNHLAWVRSGNTLYFYLNGTQDGSVGINYTLTSGSIGLTIGKQGNAASYYLNGYISEVEIYAGIALHTADFTPSGDPFLEAIGTATDNAVIFDDITPY